MRHRQLVPTDPRRVMATMQNLNWRSLGGSGVVAIISALLGCAAPNSVDTAASPVVATVRSAHTLEGEYGVAYDRRADDGIVVAKVVTTPVSAWDALLTAFSTRKVSLSILDRPAGRMGDTALVMMRQWNGKSVSRYFSCGSTLTGPRADTERIRAVLLAQLSRLRGDTLAIAIHFSGVGTAMASGNSSTSSVCTSTGQAEAELLDDVVGTLGGVRRR